MGLSDLFDTTAQWLAENWDDLENKQALTSNGVSKGSKDSKPHFEKSKFYTERLKLPFSGFTTLNIRIVSLLDAPSELSKG